MISNLPSSLQVILESIKNQQVAQGNAAGGQQLGPFPLGAQRGNFQIGASQA